jgi:transcriptional regulator with XRE-family HTH domain
MTINDKKKRLIDKLKDKEYRDAFVVSHIFNGIAFQIKAMRENMPLTQKELGTLAGMKQERISVLENQNNSNVTIDTLRRIASAFDVALMIRFVPFSDLTRWDINLSPEALKVTSFNEDTFFKDEPKAELTLGSINDNKTVCVLQDYREKKLEKSSGIGELLGRKTQAGYPPRETSNSLQQAIQGGR